MEDLFLFYARATFITPDQLVAMQPIFPRLESQDVFSCFAGYLVGPSAPYTWRLPDAAYDFHPDHDSCPHPALVFLSFGAADRRDERVGATGRVDAHDAGES